MIEDLRTLCHDCEEALRRLGLRLDELSALQALPAARAMVLLDRIRRDLGKATAALVPRPANDDGQGREPVADSGNGRRRSC